MSLLRYIREGFDRRSLIALVALVTLCSMVGYSYRNLLHPEYGMDWLLAGIWVGLSALLIWRVDPPRDLILLLTGFGGGAVIEWWGTNTQLWTYFTRERPPLWILPAWPIAALAIERLARILDRGAPWLSRAGAAYWVLIPGFIAWMISFLWPSISQPASQVVIGLMLLVALVGPRPDRDLVIFLAGSVLGIFLEYWGTSRRCWTYYTEQIPPPVAIFAHGFASVAFARVARILERALPLLRERARSDPLREA